MLQAVISGTKTFLGFVADGQVGGFIFAQVADLVLKRWPHFSSSVPDKVQHAEEPFSMPWAASV